MKKLLVFAALIAFAPLARAQDSGHWETQKVQETTPGHWENQTKQVWHEAWIEVQSKKLEDGTVEHVKVEHPGEWKAVTERVWVQPVTRTVDKRVWVADPGDHVNPWDDTPRSASGRTEAPSFVPRSARTDAPATPPARVANPYLPAPTDHVQGDPFAGTPESGLEPDPLMPPTPVLPPPPQPQAYAPQAQPQTQTVVVQSPAPQPRTVVVREPSPVVYVNPYTYCDDDWYCRPHLFVNHGWWWGHGRCYSRGYSYGAYSHRVDDCWGHRRVFGGPHVFAPHPTVHAGVGVRINRHVGTGGHHRGF